MMHRFSLKLIAAIVLASGSGLLCADSIEGTWKIESGKWQGEDSTLVYPGDADLAGAESYRMFTATHHAFFSSAPELDLYKAILMTYGLEDGMLTLSPLMTSQQGSGADERFSYSFENGKLVLEMEGVKEVWSRVE